MIIQVIDGRTHIIAGEGYYLSNSDETITGEELILGTGDSPSNYYETIKPEYIINIPSEVEEISSPEVEPETVLDLETFLDEHPEIIPMLIEKMRLSK